MTVSLSPASITPLLEPNDTPMSAAVKVSVSGNEPLVAGGNFRITLPVTGTVSDPTRLMMKVLLKNLVPYPVLGTYDAGTRTYSVEVTGLWDGWTFGVVAEPGVAFVSAAADPGRDPLGWRTPLDWETCAFRVIKHTNVWSDAQIQANVIEPARAACEALRSEGWRSPRLWIDSRTNSRVLHVTSGWNAATTMYVECMGVPAGTAWCDAASPTFSLVGLTQEQTLHIGQIYFNVTEANWAAAAPRSISYSNLLLHEMVHGSMLGTDVRRAYYVYTTPAGAAKWTHTLKAWSEGGATLTGTTYQNRGDRLDEGDVFVRLLESPQTLDTAADDPEGAPGAIYTKQDFLAWLAKKYTNGGLTFIKAMYESMSDETNGQYGLLPRDLLALYRRAIDRTFRQRFGKGLSDAYHEFALDRGYRHSAVAALRAADAALVANNAATALFPSRKQWNPVTNPTIDLARIPPLSTQLVEVTLSATLLARQTFDFSVAATGADVSPSGVRVTVFREDATGVMLPGGEIAVGDASQPVKVPMTAPVARLSIFVSNTSLEDRTAAVKLGTFGYAIFVGTWAPAGKQGNDCYRPAKILAPPVFAGVFILDKGVFTADPAFPTLTDAKYGYTLTGTGSITGDTAVVQFKEGWIDFDDGGVAKARIDMDVSWYGTRKTVPPESAAQGVTEYFEGPSNIVFKTSAPQAPCTTTFTSPTGALVGPCPKPHCQN